MPLRLELGSTDLQDAAVQAVPTMLVADLESIVQVELELIQKQMLETARKERDASVLVACLCFHMSCLCLCLCTVMHNAEPFHCVVLLVCLFACLLICLLLICLLLFEKIRLGDVLQAPC